MRELRGPELGTLGQAYTNHSIHLKWVGLVETQLGAKHSPNFQRIQHTHPPSLLIRTAHFGPS